MPTSARTPSLRQRWVTRLANRLSHLNDAYVEVFVAALMLILTVLGYPRDIQVSPVRFTVELMVCIAAASVGRWMIPGSIVVGIGLTSLALFPSDMPTWSAITLFIPITSAGARGYFWWRTFITLWYLPVAALIESGYNRSLDNVLQNATTWGFMVALMWLLGQGLWTLSQQNVRLQADRVAAIQAQRRAIARDLHDTVAYETTSIILRAEQAKLRGTADPELLDDLNYIIAAGRRSTRDLRGMMETLRRNETELAVGINEASPWRITAPDELLAERIQELEELGFTVEWSIDANLAQLPESMRDALTKVTYEATANIAKHGKPGTTCSILIEGDDQTIEAAFINVPIRKSGIREHDHSTRLGIIGIQERVEALGGECQITSIDPWIITVILPIEPQRLDKSERQESPI